MKEKRGVYHQYYLFFTKICIWLSISYLQLGLEIESYLFFRRVWLNSDIKLKIFTYFFLFYYLLAQKPNIEFKLMLFIKCWMMKTKMFIKWLIQNFLIAIPMSERIGGLTIFDIYNLYFFIYLKRISNYIYWFLHQDEM